MRVNMIFRPRFKSREYIESIQYICEKSLKNPSLGADELGALSAQVKALKNITASKYDHRDVRLAKTIVQNKIKESLERPNRDRFTNLPETRAKIMENTYEWIFDRKKLPVCVITGKIKQH